MVLLTLSEAGKAAIEQYCQSAEDSAGDSDLSHAVLKELEIGSAISHASLIHISSTLLKNTSKSVEETLAWRLDTLLKGSTIYVPPPPPKPEPSPEYKELMQRLRKEEEQRQYERMTNAQSGHDILSKHFSGPNIFNPMLSHGKTDIPVLDEATYQDIDRQLTLIINVLVTVIASGITIWFAARYWAAPQRIALSLLGAVVIAIAEVAVYMGYIRRLQDAKVIERKKKEKVKITDTWVIDQTSSKALTEKQETIRHRKGKHR